MAIQVANYKTIGM